MKNLQLVIFDMAGTTVKDNKEVEHCFYQAAVQTELAASRERINDMMGWPKIEVVRTLWDEAIGKTHIDYPASVQHTYDTFRSILEEHYSNTAVFPTEGTLDTFDWLREQGVKIALTTGFYRKVTDIILRQLGWDKGLDADYLGSADSVIDLSLASDQVERGRPFPDLIRKTMNMLSIEDPGHVIKIGDTPSDLKAGKAAGCGLTLGVTNGTHTRSALQRFDSDGLLDSMAEFPEFVMNKLTFQTSA